ncbi:methyltransferase domain-containing protein [Saccharopolyspora sp. K220]|uniref:TRM11 family SAM-dependent methyltransferase n=1 Tax=Saccharopolyspora soli TaxID=2926618 RepID=UPI001F567448|nr:methyltransferase domain-containing protein [Saccharopolyspora soli]MCI2417574.1 methyltransferase domain-containing protein [Saccharopolyspora soli]
MSTEILLSESASITSIAHREVIFQTWEGARGARPRTADDVFLLAGRRDDIGPHKRDLASLTELVHTLDLDSLQHERRIRGGPHDFAGIEISASYLGRRTYNRYDIEDTIGPALANRLRVPYHSRRGGTAPPPGYCGWRLTLDGTNATLLLRLGEFPAHRREYKTATIPGTLHPPVAAAMALLADLHPGQTVLDPCCGAGTLLIEAHHAVPGMTLIGFDLASRPRRAAKINSIGTAPLRIERADAAALPVADRSIDRVLCNPPWGSQVRAGGFLASDPEQWWCELARVLADDGRAVVLVPDARSLSYALDNGLIPTHVQQLSLFGRHPLMTRLERVLR